MPKEQGSKVLTCGQAGELKVTLASDAVVEFTISRTTLQRMHQEDATLVKELLHSNAQQRPVHGPLSDISSRHGNFFEALGVNGVNVLGQLKLDDTATTYRFNITEEQPANSSQLTLSVSAAIASLTQQTKHHIKHLEDTYRAGWNSYIAPYTVARIAGDETPEGVVQSLDLDEVQAPDIQHTLAHFMAPENHEALLLVLGEPGAGKSLSLQRFAHTCCEQFEQTETGWLPIFLELKAYSAAQLKQRISHHIRSMLKASGLSDAEATVSFQRLRQSGSLRLVVFFDGFDEVPESPCARIEDNEKCRATDIKNFYDYTGANEWPVNHIKLIVSSRPRSLPTLDLIHQIFGRGEAQQPVMQTYLLPFHDRQIEHYLEKRALRPQEQDYYSAHLKSDASVKALLRQPFVLSLFVDVLPAFAAKQTSVDQLTKYRIYKKFVSQWFHREVMGKLSAKERQLLGEVTPGDGSLESSFREMAKAVAVGMFEQGTLLTDLVDKVERSPQQAVWEYLLREVAHQEQAEVEKQAAITKKNRYAEKKKAKDFLNIFKNRLESFKRTSPLRRSGERYGFIHKSFYEFFIAESIIHAAVPAHSLFGDANDGLGSVAALNGASIDHPPVGFEPRVEGLSRLLGFGEAGPGRRIQAEPEVLLFLAGYYRGGSSQSRALVACLFAVIARSKGNACYGQAAANAVTILNGLRVSLGHRAWRGVHLRGADLSYGRLVGTDLREADLRGVNLSHGCLNQVRLAGARLDELSFGEWPKLDFTECGGLVSAVAFHPQASWLAVAVSSAIVLCDALSGERLGAPLRGHEDGVKSVSFGPAAIGGRWLLASGSLDGSCRLWEVSDPTQAAAVGAPLRGHEGGVNSVSFSPGPIGGRWLLASGSWDNSCRLWEVSDPTQAAAVGAPLREHEDGVKSVSFSPAAIGGRWLLASGSDDQSCRLWEVSDPTQAAAVGAPLRGHEDGVKSVSFSPAAIGGRWLLASGSDDQSCRLWEVSDPTQAAAVGAPLRGHEGGVMSVSFSPAAIGGRWLLASGSWDGSCRLWEVSDPTQAAAVGAPLRGHEGGVMSVSFSPAAIGGRWLLASGSDDGSCRLWDVSQNEVIVDYQIIEWSSNIKFFHFFLSDSGKVLLALCDAAGSISLWRFNDTGNAVLSEVIMSRGYTTTAHGASFQGCRGLSALNRRLLIQYGASDAEETTLKQAPSPKRSESVELIDREVSQLLPADSLASHSPTLFSNSNRPVTSKVAILSKPVKHNRYLPVINRRCFIGFVSLGILLIAMAITRFLAVALVGLSDGEQHDSSGTDYEPEFSAPSI